MSDDLLAGESADNQETEVEVETEVAPEAELDTGPPPSEVQYPDWVPGELHAPEKRGELLTALGLKTGQVLPSERPDYIPEKFWNDEGLALDKFAKSYTELEKRMSGKPPAPNEPPETYEVKLPEGVELGEDAQALSEDDVALFKELGLNNEGAQKLTTHFWNSVMPVLAEKQGELETEKVAGAWNLKADAPEFKERLQQLRAWGEAELPEEVLGHLRKSATGVQALWSMMQNKVTVPGSGDGGSGAKTPDEIQALVSDDRYWQDGNEAYRAMVQKEIEKANPG